jgi:hypothetical protein
MVITCPNKNDPAWKKLVAELGDERFAYRSFNPKKPDTNSATAADKKENCYTRRLGSHFSSRRTRVNSDSRSSGFEKSWFRQDGGLRGTVRKRTFFRLAAICAGRDNYLEGLT